LAALLCERLIWRPPGGEETMEKIPMTAAGYTALETELKHCQQVERPRIIQQITDARTHGDLSENAEYDAAKEAQGLLELKISKMEETLSNARIVDESQLDTSKVLILSKVTIKNVKTGQKMSYTLVPENEADLKSGKLSVTSPIAKGLLGCEKGDKTEVTVPSGKMTFEIIDISR
jgi:transcription elongation factor GreA